MLSRIKSDCAGVFKKTSNLTTKKAPYPLLVSLIVTEAEDGEVPWLAYTVVTPYWETGMGRLLGGGGASTAAKLEKMININAKAADVPAVRLRNRI